MLPEFCWKMFLILFFNVVDRNQIFLKYRTFSSDKVFLNSRRPSGLEYNTVCVGSYSIYPDGQQRQGQVSAVRCKQGQQYVIYFSPVPFLVGSKEPPARTFIYNAGATRKACILWRSISSLIPSSRVITVKICFDPQEIATEEKLQLSMQSGGIYFCKFSQCLSI